MASKLDESARMSIKVLKEKGATTSQVARLLGVTEGAVRYNLRRQEENAEDGRRRQVPRARAVREPILAWVQSRKSQGLGLNLAALHDWLREEHGYEGSLRSIQRFVRRELPTPKRRARRRIETPPGAQAQADWAVFPSMKVGGETRQLYAFVLELSHSRKDAIVWSESKNQLSWHHVHNEALKRLSGVPATIRVDNEKTAMSRGAGPWGVVNPAYRRYAEVARFLIDPCLPRCPHHKGKVERRILGVRRRDDPSSQSWESLEALQAWSDERGDRSARRRTCPVTGQSVHDTWKAEIPKLGELPELPEPFDLVVTRRVSDDCRVRFEGRSYTVPFASIGRKVEVRGCAGRVQIVAGSKILGTYPRSTPERILIDPSCYDGEATDDVLPPIPLGRMASRLEEIGAMDPEVRPIDLYAALAEVAR